MSHKFPFYISLFLFLCFLKLSVQTKTFNIIRHDLPSPSNKLPLLNLKATSSGIVPITWPVYAVDADFVDQSDIVGASKDKKDQKSGLMGLALYTNESYFGGDCHNFLKYDCDIHDCFPNKEDIRKITLPYFTIEGYGLHTQLFMDYDFFCSTYMGLIYAEKCTPAYSASSNVIYGMIGLGLEGYSFNNFVGSYPIFSIFLDFNGRTGKLIFDCASEMINKTGYNTIVQSTKNWNIEFTGLNFNETKIDLDGTVIFDINLPFVGIPVELYSLLLALLRKDYNVICFDPSVYLLGCVYEGNYHNLPPLTIGGELIIPPQVYLHPILSKNNFYHLMLYPTSLDDSDPSVIQVMEGFENHIIMGAPFIQHFYVCFEAKRSSYQILIHEKDENGYNYNLLQLIGFALAVAVPILTCTCFCILSCIKSKETKKSKGKGKDKEEGVKEKLISENTEDKSSSIVTKNESKIIVNESKNTIEEEGAQDSMVIFENPPNKNPNFPRAEIVNFSFSESSSILEKQKAV